MSKICDALLLCYADEDRAVADINSELAPLADRPDLRQGFNEIDMGECGGYKVFVSQVWAAAFNHPIGPSEIEAALAVAEFDEPSRAVLVLNPYDEDEAPTVKTVAELQAVQKAPRSHPDDNEAKP